MSTQKSTNIQVTGLQLNSNPHTLTPGSLQVADNVLSRKAGALQPLNYPEDITEITLDVKLPARIFCDWVPKYFAALERSPGAGPEANTLRFSNSNTEYISISNPDVIGSLYRFPLRFNPCESQAAYNRNRHIFTEHSSPIVVENISESSHDIPRQAGLPPPVTVHAAVSGDATQPVVLLAGNYFAYRALIRRDQQRFSVTSAPTFPYIYGGEVADTAVSLSVYFDAQSDPVRVGDSVVVYRTEQQATIAALGGDFRQVVSVEISATDLALGFVSLKDTTLDSFRGATLYTNASEEGALQTNLMPPASTDVAVYADTTFYRTKNTWPTCLFEIPGAFGDLEFGSPADRPSGIGRHRIDGASTTGSFFLTGVLPGGTDGIVVGQQVVSAAVFPLGTTVVQVLGPTIVEFSAPATVTNPAVTVRVLDTIVITAFKDGFSRSGIVAIDPYDGFASFARNLENLKDGGGVPMRGFRLLVGGLDGSYYRPVTGAFPTTTGVAFSVWCPIPGLWDSFTARVSNGANYRNTTPDVFVGSTFGFLKSIQDLVTNRLFYSKTSEPEHIPPSNFIDVGRENVLRMIPTQSSLLVFCTDGLYRVTGVGNDWTVTQVDRTAALVHPDAVGTLDGNVFAWLSDGLNLCSESGVQCVSARAVDPLIKGWAKTFNTFAQPTFGPTVCGDDINNEVWLNIAYDDPEAGYAMQTFVGSLIMNANTGAFTTQSFIKARCQAYAPYRLELVTGIGDVVGDDPITVSSYTHPSETVWLGATVLFNPISSGDLGVLKQWVDVNLFFEHVISNMGTDSVVQFLFSPEDAAGSLNVRTFDADTANKIHAFVPRRVSVREKLIFGFKTLFQILSPGVYNTSFFDFYGFTARLRIASETLKR